MLIKNRQADTNFATNMDVYACTQTCTHKYKHIHALCDPVPAVPGMQEYEFSSAGFPKQI